MLPEIVTGSSVAGLLAALGIVVAMCVAARAIHVAFSFLAASPARRLRYSDRPYSERVQGADGAVPCDSGALSVLLPDGPTPPSHVRLCQ